MGALTLDLAMIKYIGAGVLILFCVLLFLIPWVRDLLKKATISKLPVKLGCSDDPPPGGFAAHLKIIEEAAPNATPDVWWNYAKAEMTKAQVALEEAKLARKTQ